MASGGLLAGKRCLVTGGNRGIGKAIAETFAREGASLALVARSKDKLEEVADSCQSQGAAACEIYPFDLVNTGDIDSLAQRILADKQVDVLVNNAGIMVSGSAFEGDMTDWERCLKLNVLAPMGMTHAFSPGMVKRKDGLIINIGSIAGLEPMKSTPVYAASKWGLRGWSLSCYEALRQDNVKVVAIHPAGVATQMTEGRFRHDRCIQTTDIAEAAMLAVRTSSSCVPQEITLRLTLPAGL